MARVENEGEELGHETGKEKRSLEIREEGVAQQRLEEREKIFKSYVEKNEKREDKPRGIYTKKEKLQDMV